MAGLVVTPLFYSLFHNLSTLIPWIWLARLHGHPARCRALHHKRALVGKRGSW